MATARELAVHLPNIGQLLSSGDPQLLDVEAVDRRVAEPRSGILGGLAGLLESLRQSPFVLFAGKLAEAFERATSVVALGDNVVDGVFWLVGYL